MYIQWRHTNESICTYNGDIQMETYVHAMETYKWRHMYIQWRHTNGDIFTTYNGVIEMETHVHTIET